MLFTNARARPRGVLPDARLIIIASLAEPESPQEEVFKMAPFSAQSRLPDVHTHVPVQELALGAAEQGPVIDAFIMALA